MSRTARFALPAALAIALSACGSGGYYDDGGYGGTVVHHVHHTVVHHVHHVIVHPARPAPRRVGGRR